MDRAKKNVCLLARDRMHAAHRLSLISPVCCTQAEPALTCTHATTTQSAAKAQTDEMAARRGSDAKRMADMK